MRLLLIHADRFEYEARERAVKEPEPLDESHKRGALENGLVVFSTVEKIDEQDPEQIATNAASSVEEVLGWLKTKKVMVYPYKSFTITAKGHPLSELSRTITADTKSRQAASPVKTEYVIMDQEGKLHSPEDFSFRPQDAEFKSLVEKEALKKGLTGGDPHFLDYARRFGIEWESYADVGQMRFGPESNLIMDLLAEYAGQVALFQTPKVPDAGFAHLPQKRRRSDTDRRQGPPYHLRRDQEVEQRIRLALQHHTIILRSKQRLIHGTGKGREEAYTAQLCSRGIVLLGAQCGVQHH